jgi:hypothetical protein
VHYLPDKNDIGDKGMIQIIAAIKIHRFLKVLDIRSNKISNAMLQRVAEYQKSNSTIAINF